MIPLIDHAVATNIAAHTQQAWTYGTPNDDTAEIIITNGLLPFYNQAQQRGGSTTIVDVKVGTTALDIKCRDVIGFFNKAPSRRQLSSDNRYFEIIKDTLWVKVPNSVVCPVRRPKTNTQKFKGDCKTAIMDQIAEYKSYASRTVAAAGCTELHSVLLLYGQDLGYKAIYIEEQDFGTPVPSSFETGLNRQGQENSYMGLDNQGRLLYKISDYSEGSTNFNKRFDCVAGYLFVWPSTNLNSNVTSVTDWTANKNYTLCV